MNNQNQLFIQFIHYFKILKHFKTLIQKAHVVIFYCSVILVESSESLSDGFITPHRRRAH